MKNKSLKQKIIISLIVVIVAAFVIVFCQRQLVKKELKMAISSSWSSFVNAEQPDFLKEIEQKSNYYVKQVNKCNDIYLIEVEIVYSDIKSVLTENNNDFVMLSNESEVNQYLSDILSQAEMKNMVVEIYANKTENGYSIIFTDEFIDYMSGGLYSYTKRLMIEEFL